MISGTVGEIHKMKNDISTGLSEPIQSSQSQNIESIKQEELMADALENVDNVIDELIDYKKKKREQDEVTSTAGKKIEIR